MSKVHIHRAGYRALCNATMPYPEGYQDPDDVNCLQCINDKIDDLTCKIGEWIARRDQVKETKDEITPEMEKIFQKKFKDILA